MIITLTNAEKRTHSQIFDEMFKARAMVFRDRLGWDVKVRDGKELDHYDIYEDPIYLASLDNTGQLQGSLRLLPTTGEAMLHNEFSDFFDEPLNIRSPLAWECTRFCVHPAPHFRNDLGRLVSSELLTGLCELALASGITQVVGLYDYSMTRIYRRIGWSPIPLATSRPEVGNLIAGIWEVSPAALVAMSAQTALLRNRQTMHSAA